MRDDRIHIFIEGEDLLIARNDTASLPQNSVRLERGDMIDTLLQVFDMEFALTASGQVMLARTAPAETEERQAAGREPPIATIDRLAKAMVCQVLAAPDEDDIAALEQCIERLETAKKIAVQARKYLRGD